jgi:cellobiose phosphorylase
MEPMLELSRRAAPGLQHATQTDASGFGLHQIGNPDGLRLSVLPNGCIYAIEYQEILISQVLANPLAGGIHRLYLRVFDDQGICFTEVVGPRATSRLQRAADRVVWSGEWRGGLLYRCTCWLHPSDAGWFFHVEVENRSGDPVHCDTVMVQDVGLATRGQVRNNELFTSQYLDHKQLDHPEFGVALMTRQNLPQHGETHPWLLQGCFSSAVGFTTDGFDFFGILHRAGEAPAALSRPVIGRKVRQHETGYLAVQSHQAVLHGSARHAWTFFSHFLADHLDPSSGDDLNRIQDVCRMRADMMRQLSVEPALDTVPRRQTVFQTCRPYPAEDFTEQDLARHFPGARRHEEREAGRLLSFFTADDARHVVLRDKELRVARPHGHIMRAGRGLTPDAEVISCTCYAAGGFASQLTLGNTSLGKLLSGIRDPLNLVLASGLRILVREDVSGKWLLLGVPSAFEMTADQCRWHYKRDAGVLTVSCCAAADEPALTFEVRSAGQAVELLICGEIAAGPTEYDSRPSLSIDRHRPRITIKPDPRSLPGSKLPGMAFHIVTSTSRDVQEIGADEIVVDNGNSRNLPYVAIRTRPTNAFCWTVCGTFDAGGRSAALCEKYESRNVTAWRDPGQVSHFWDAMTAGLRIGPAARPQPALLQDALTWFARDAVIHLGTPRGLEQHNGGAWGVRDVCQGSVEFLLSYGHHKAVAEIILRVFAQQYHRRGDWPQWFMFPPFEQIRAQECHGDVPIWPLKALCDYLQDSDDGSILERRVLYTDDTTCQPTVVAETVVEHTDRLLSTLVAQYLPGVSLPRYGEGDWDDSLQPADPKLRDQMVSSWTTALLYQTLRRFAAAMERFGDSGRAARVNRLADEIHRDFQRHLMPDDIVAGFARFQAACPVEFLLHPRDTRTGLRYRLIPMTRGIISGVFSPAQATRHLELVREHLLYPDGARLMDRPARYDGGRETIFRRSETAAFFGREIGLQYVHAHLRYAEALAVMGRATELWHALCVVNPIAVTDLVPGARRRQRNCYFSSSDAAFDTRYAALLEYDKLRRGEVPTDGGWRIYSSGPGIYTNLVVRHLFGLRRNFQWYEFDPVLPKELDGVGIELDQGGRRVGYRFHVGSEQRPVQRIVVNGSVLNGVSTMPNPYRRGGLRVLRQALDGLLTSAASVVDLYL